MKLKILVSCIFFMILFCQNIYSNEIDLVINLDKYKTNYNYNINLVDKNISEFSFEVPKNSKVIEIRSEKENFLNYLFLDDEIVITNNLNSKNIEIEIETQNGYLDEGKFAYYLDFSFFLNKSLITLKFEEEFIYDLRKVEIYPKDNKIQNDSVIFDFENIDREILLFVDIRSLIDEIKQNNDNQKLFEPINYLLFLISIPMILFVVLISYILLKKEINKNQITLSKKISIRKEKFEKKIKDKENFESVLNKYLTENEKQIANLIKKHEGITQLDILSFLPKITKSNLSKIISKLHQNKFLTRVRVGKENKIYLGEKLKF